MNEDRYRDIISQFQSSQLQTLLGTFGRSRNGLEPELRERALELLRTKPPGINIATYYSKIMEINGAMQNNDVSNNNDVSHDQGQMMSMQAQQQGLNKPPQNQQQMYLVPVEPHLLFQTMPLMQIDMYGNSNVSGNNNIQYDHQPTVPRTTMPVSQQLNMGAVDQVGYDLNASHIDNSITAQSVANVRFKKLPFFEVVEVICKPRVLIGKERCSIQNCSQAMKECVHKMPFTIQQINLITMNRDEPKDEYLYQIQIRICLLEPPGSTEITDFLPLGLCVRIFSKQCALPPTAPNTCPGIEVRRTARPINCTQLLKLHPRLINIVTFNWIPDGKTYVWGIFLVKKLTSDFLLQKLLSKEARSSGETKKNIIKTLADVDPNLATTSYRFSLTCPLSKMRMEIPAKSVNCEHLQCFDASTFISMNEKTSTWLCPTCNKACDYDDIQIESYFLDIVTSSSLPKSCKEIELLADGAWRVYVEPEKNKTTDIENNKEDPLDFVDIVDSDEGIA